MKRTDFHVWMLLQVRIPAHNMATKGVIARVGGQHLTSTCSCRIERTTVSAPARETLTLTHYTVGTAAHRRARAGWRSAARLKSRADEATPHKQPSFERRPSTARASAAALTIPPRQSASGDSDRNP